MNAAKDLALAKMRDTGALRYMLPGMTAELDVIDEVFGGDPWPYGIEPNRPTLEALVQYMAEQSLIKAPIPIETCSCQCMGSNSEMTRWRTTAGPAARARHHPGGMADREPHGRAVLVELALGRGVALRRANSQRRADPPRRLHALRGSAAAR